MSAPVQPRPHWPGVLASFFIPGLGSMINGSVGLGVLILAVWVLGLALTFVLVGFYIIFVAWVWGLADGVMSADRWNRKHGAGA
jgi:TM2 domain-containing membrane protein YozV